MLLLSLICTCAGFLGRRIVEQLLESDAALRVVVIDVLVPKERHPRVEYVRASITLPEHVRRALEGGIDAVIHTASIIPDLRMQGSKALHIVNVDGTANIIQACIELG